MRVTVTLAPRDAEGLVRLARAVSDPTSPRYRRYMDPAQWAARFGPPVATVAGVEQRMRAEGFRLLSAGEGDLSLTFAGTAAAAERAFRAPLVTARLAGRQRFLNQAPAQLPPGVQAVYGLDDLPVAHRLGTNRARGAMHLPPARGSSVSGCPSRGSGVAYTPGELASAYGLDALYGQGLTGGGQSVASFELADYSDQDIATYVACFGGSTANVSRLAVDGGPLSGGAGTSEATADVEDLLGLAPGVSVVVYEAPDTAAGIYDNYATIIKQDRVSVLATSWGECESEVPPGMASSENVLFQQAALQGQSVLAASGDSGSEDCYVPGLDNDTSLAVDDPASQPYVTGVGGTSLTSVSPRQETTWNGGTGTGGGAGGGGISSNWAMPSYQRSVLSTQSSSTPCGASPGWCREVPDVSASADVSRGYFIYCTAGDCAGGGWLTVGGTSLGSPLWAAIVALSNQGCSAGPAGFLNPVLYANANTVANDITSGNNDLLHRYGLYPAGTGYDMATGLGSPSASGLAAALCTHASTPPTPVGYRMVASDGGIFTFGAAGFYGSAGGLRLNRPVVGMAATPDGRGYWEVASDGGIFSFGDAGFFGSTGGLRLNRPIVGMAPTADGRGYWLVASDGGVFCFGDAGFHGSGATAATGSPVIGLAPDFMTGGYWMATASGTVLAFRAPYLGGTTQPSAPIVALVASPDGAGYRLAGADGTLYAYGDATALGSLAGHRLAQPVVGGASSHDGFGYWMVAADGGIFSFGDAPFMGSTGAIRLNQPIVGISALP